MRRLALALALFAVPAAWTQVARHANQDLHSEEGRRRLIQMLGAPDRADRLAADKLVAALNLRRGATVVDLGTGAGVLLPFLSQAVGPEGRVIAQDIIQEFLDKAAELARAKGLTNVEFLLGTEKDPRLEPGSADLILAVDSYHHFDYPEEMLAGIRRALRDGGRFVVVDYYQKSFRDPAHIRLEKGDVIREIEANGFRLLSNEEHIPGSQYRLVFRKR
jgi:ubiquinone/menaquinone biosynthesis C-methylase UbiE